MNRIDAIKAVSRNVSDLIIDSSPASAGASFMDFLALVHPVTNQLQGRDAYIYSGGGLGQQRTVTSYDATNRRVVFKEVFTTAPSTNASVVIFGHFRKDEYDAAVDRVVGMAGLKYLQEKVATLALVATQYEYAVPSGFEYINSLRLVPTASNATDYEAEDYVNRMYEFSPRYWHIEANPLGTFVIAFDPRKISLDSFDNYNIRVMGQSKAAINPTDNATIPEPLEEFIVQGASMLLASQRINENREWQAKFYMFRDLYRDLEDYIFRHPRGKRVG